MREQICGTELRDYPTDYTRDAARDRAARPVETAVSKILAANDAAQVRGVIGGSSLCAPHRDTSSSERVPAFVQCAACQHPIRGKVDEVAGEPFCAKCGAFVREAIVFDLSALEVFALGEKR